MEGKEKNATASMTTTSDEEEAALMKVVPSTAKISDGAIKRRLRQPKTKAVKRHAAVPPAKLPAGVSDQKPAKQSAAEKSTKQGKNTSPSEEDIEYVSEEGEGCYKSGESGEIAHHISDIDEEMKSNQDEDIELEQARIVIAQGNEAIEDIRKRMEPFLQLLKKKQEAGRQEEAEQKKKQQQLKQQQQQELQQKQKQQQLKNQQQQQQHKQLKSVPKPQRLPQNQQQQPQQQKKTAIPANGSTRAAPSGSSSSGASKSTAAPATNEAAQEEEPLASTSSAARQQHQQQPRNKSEKVPPIRTYKVDINDIKQVCRSATQNKFQITIINEKQKRYSIQCFTLDEYKLVKECLKEATAEFFSFTPRSEKPKTVLLKGISSYTEPEELLVELREKASDDLEFIGVKPFSTVRSRREGHKLPIFIVSLSPQSRLESLRKITVLDYQVIHWEKLMRHDDMLQCMRCQRFGHAAANCEMQLRCVKCAETHNRGECSLGNERVEDLTKLKCVICGNEGHPANFRGCPKVQEIRDKQANQKAAESRTVRQAPIGNAFVRPDVSYAKSAKGMGNTRQAPPPVAPQVQVPKAPAGQPDIVSLLLSIQSQLTGLQSQIKEQGERVDYLYSLLPGQAQLHG